MCYYLRKSMMVRCTTASLALERRMRGEPWPRRLVGTEMSVIFAVSGLFLGEFENSDGVFTTMIHHGGSLG